MKQVNKQTLIQVFFYFVACGLCTSCDKDDQDPLTATRLTVESSVRDFLPSDPHTRASISDGTLTFEVGDAIGVTAVKDGNILPGADNVKMTYAGSGKWDGKLYNYPGATYLAYYPYNSNFSGKKSTTEIINSHSILDDQSTIDNFKASNLLIAEAQVASGATTLTFAFAPAYGLLDVRLFATLRGKTTIDGQPFSYIIKGLEKFSVQCPKCYKASSTSYLRIIKPMDYTAVKVEYQYNGVTRFSYSPNTYTEGGKRRTANLVGTIKHDLKVGDFLYKDGSFFPKEWGGAQSPGIDDGLMGIIFYLGRHPMDTYQYANVSTVSGYAASATVRVLSDGKGVPWGPNDKTIGCWADQNAGTWTGYQNTQIMKAAAGSYWGTSDVRGYPAAYYATSYGGFQVSNSGWYLPSINQLAYLASVSSAVFGGSVPAGVVGHDYYAGYSSSTEWVSSTTLFMCHLWEGQITYNYKTNGDRVRSVVTF